MEEPILYKIMHVKKACKSLIFTLYNRPSELYHARPLVRFPSGQRDQTVNLTRKLRWFESTPHHHPKLLSPLS